MKQIFALGDHTRRAPGGGRMVELPGGGRGVVQIPGGGRGVELPGGNKSTHY